LSYYREHLGFNFEYDLYEVEYDVMTCCREEVVNSNVVETLKYLKKWGYKLLVLSNSIFSEKSLCRYLKSHGLLIYFDDVFSSANCGCRKPGIEFFNYLSKKANIELTKEVYLIGNTYEKDVIGAINSNITPIYYQRDDQSYYLWN